MISLVVKGNDYIKVTLKVTNQIDSATKKEKFALNIKALQNKISEKPFGQDSSIKLRNLINTYKSRRDFAELLTSRAVKRCQDRIEALIASWNTGMLDVKEICSQSESILREELFNRFKLNLPVRLVRLENDYSELCRLLAQYQRTKKRTLFITGLVEEWNREAWGQIIPRFISDPSLSWIVSHSDLNSVILKGLGINSEAEEQEYNSQTMSRMNGLQMAVKLGITRNITAQAAEIFYQFHDMLIDAQLASKLNGLIAKLPVPDVYQGEAINA